MFNKEETHSVDKTGKYPDYIQQTSTHNHGEFFFLRLVVYSTYVVNVNNFTEHLIKFLHYNISPFWLLGPQSFSTNYKIEGQIIEHCNSFKLKTYREQNHVTTLFNLFIYMNHTSSVTHYISIKISGTTIVYIVHIVVVYIVKRAH